MFEEYEVVELMRDLDDKALKKGTRGAIVMVYPGSPPEYEVEFVDQNGTTIAVETISGEHLIKAV
ncbi:MAG: DUF4926 domain-containing protein [Gemmataceae bacterium]